MTEVAILAPGPSASAALAETLKGKRLIVVGNAWELAPWAEALVANDRAWWAKHPDAMQFQGAKYSANRVRGVELVANGRPNLNSGTLAMIVAVHHLGATAIQLHGFDFHGTHFFGPYTNGLRNTAQHQRKQHLQQYERWGRANKAVEVVNCTPGSAMACFPVARLEETGLLEPAADEAGQGGDVCQRAAA